MDNSTINDGPKDLLDQLTPKQAECLELVLRHRTSKQIARSLGISRYTVDQRLDAARRTLRVDTRLDAAAKYAELKGAYEPFVYGSVGMVSPGVDEAYRTQSVEEPVVRFEEGVAIRFTPPWETSFSHRLSPRAELVAGGLARRVWILLGMTLAMMVLIIAGLAMFASLSEVLRSL